MTQPVSPGDPMELVASEWNEIRRRVLPASGIGIGAGGWIPDMLIAKAPSGGIAARSGTTCGSATCDVYTLDDSDDLTVTDRTVVVKNISGTAVSANAWLIVAPEFTRRAYIVIVESCEPAS